MPGRRKGTLSDEQTLAMYEQDKIPMIAICVHEGMTPYGVISRIARARRVTRTKGPSLRRQAAKVPQATYTTFDELNSAVRRLQESIRELEHA